MPRVHNQLRRRTSLLLAYQLAMGEDEEGWGVERFGETLTPTFDIERRIEHWVLFEGYPFGCRVNRDLVAAEFAYITLRNPTGSNLLAVVDRVRTTANCDVLLGIREVPDLLVLDISQTVVPTDVRAFVGGAAPGSSQLVLGSGTQVADPMDNNFDRLTGAQVTLETQVVLAPGSELVVATVVVATAAFISFRGRARPLSPLELPPE